MNSPDSPQADHFLTANDIPDDQLVELTQEMLELALVDEDDISNILTRDDALNALECLALAAGLNPMLKLLDKLGGELPPEAIISVEVPEKESNARPQPDPQTDH